MAKKTKVTTWITRDASRGLRDLAAAHRLTVSQVARRHHRARPQGAAEMAGLGLLGPSVQTVVKREAGRTSDRLAHLMARTVLESATAQRWIGPGQGGCPLRHPPAE